MLAEPEGVSHDLADFGQTTDDDADDAVETTVLGDRTAETTTMLETEATKVIPNPASRTRAVQPNRTNPENRTNPGKRTNPVNRINPMRRCWSNPTIFPVKATRTTSR